MRQPLSKRASGALPSWSDPLEVLLPGNAIQPLKHAGIRPAQSLDLLIGAKAVE